MKNRKQTEEYILKYIGKLEHNTGVNETIYRKFFARISDEEFDQWMKDLKSGAKFLTFRYPNLGKVKMSVRNNIKVCRELGYEPFQRLWVSGKEGMDPYLTPVKQLVIWLPLRRASQMIIDKISVPENKNAVDNITGQPTKSSSKAALSLTEFELIASMGLESSLVELTKVKGGDAGAFRAYNALLSQQGSASLNVVKQYGTGVEATKAMSAYLTAAHLKNTL